MPGDLSLAEVDPLTLLGADRAQAATNADPMASLCLLATVGGGEPQARIVILRDVTEGAPTAPPDESLDSRLGIFINRTSPKFHEIAESATVAVVVYLPSLGVQYRLRGGLEPIPAGIVRASWVLRPPVPKRMDWLYESHPQSSVVNSREQLIDLLGEGLPDAAPDSAAGYYLVARTIERLNLTTTNGVHDRRRYSLDSLGDGGWTEQVLVP